MLESTLTRMFDYTEVSSSRPLENFTTEALALAINTENGPILDVLGRHDILSPDLVTHATAETQVPIEHEGHRGFIDLVLRIESPQGPREVWFENKAHAPESGDQLTRYRAAIDARAGGGVPQHLVVLAPLPISTKVKHEFIRWQEVADAARRRTERGLWADLAAFLKEYRMTTDATLPITDSEAASLDDAHRLFEKMAYILWRVNAAARDKTPEWPDERWVRDDRVRRTLLTQFAERGRLRLQEGKGYAAHLIWGAEPHPDGARFIVAVEVSRKWTAARTQVLRSVDGLASDWTRSERISRLLSKERPAVDFATDDHAVDWFIACLDELKAVGLIDLIPTLKKEPVVDDAEGAEDGDEDAEEEA